MPFFELGETRIQKLDPLVGNLMSPAAPASVTARWLNDTLVELVSGIPHLRTTATLTGTIMVGSLEAHNYGFNGSTWDPVGIVGDALKVFVDDINIDGLFDAANNPNPDHIGLVASTNGLENGLTKLLTTTAVGAKNALDVNDEQVLAELGNILVELTHLDDLDRDVGPVGVDTLRVHLSDESLAALEEIDVNINTVDVHNKNGAPEHYNGSATTTPVTITPTFETREIHFHVTRHNNAFSRRLEVSFDGGTNYKTVAYRGGRAVIKTEVNSFIVRGDNGATGTNYEIIAIGI